MNGLRSTISYLLTEEDDVYDYFMFIYLIYCNAYFLLDSYMQVI